ncbi:hypothetical protein M514_15259 [Trichuris suis]|uniref:Uncharacterized protein n=1 Tax=Trichuris suis TaxID=68888 RepID=A0A085NSH7_9BILA|nr:hypothetical protein M514_15259 [Trichuris suis]
MFASFIRLSICQSEYILNDFTLVQSCNYKVFRLLSVSKVCRETNYQRRKIKESFYIRHNPNINRDEGSGVSEAWIPISYLTECFTITNRPHTIRHSSGSEGTRGRGIDLPDDTPTAPGQTHV